MAIKFRKYERFDKSKAEYGVWHSPIDEAGNEYGSFKTSLFDEHNKYIELAVKRFVRENQDHEKNKGKFSDVFAFVEVCLHDWKDVFDEKGKPVPFSKEVAYDLLTDEDNLWLARTLTAMTRNVLNYQGDPVATQEEDLGNSNPS